MEWVSAANLSAEIATLAASYSTHDHSLVIGNPNSEPKVIFAIRVDGNPLLVKIFQFPVFA
jgi:hypothetical protein